MSGSLPNDNDPEDVLRQILDWSQNRPTRDLHKLQTLIENANGLDEPHHPVAPISPSAVPVPPPAAPVPPPVAPAAPAPAQNQSDDLVGLFNFCFRVCQKNKIQICFYFKAIAALCIAICFGFLLGIVVDQAGGAFVDGVRELWNNRGGNLPVGANVPPAGNMEEQFNYNYGDMHLKGEKTFSQSQDNGEKSESTCNGDSDGSIYKEEINILNEQLATCTDQRSQHETECQTNITTCSSKLVFWEGLASETSNKLGDVIEEYGINNGKEWSQWCMQEWKKQGNTQTPPARPCVASRSAPLDSKTVYSRPTASVDIDKIFNSLGTINTKLKDSIRK